MNSLLMVKNSERKILMVTITSFVSLWLLYFISELFSGRMHSKRIIILNCLIPSIFLSIIALIFYTVSKRNRAGFNVKFMLLSIFALTSVDQILKFLIRFLDAEKVYKNLFVDWLHFAPFLNTSGSWAASRYGIILDIRVLSLLNLLGVLLIIEIYRFYSRISSKNFWSDICFILFMSGALASIIDKFFFQGSLDFIAIGHLFIADIKDFYLTLSISCLVVMTILYGDLKSNIKEDLQLVKAFCSFLFKDIFSIKTRQKIKS